ncbi:MAG: hypothetical protein PHU85_13375 [Phycisphaerae bacterium]|jgi:hypothetical protein|nr:hypothetical protein [Phycisphaerae bacterium]
MPQKTAQAIAAELAADDEEVTAEEREAIEKSLTPDKPAGEKSAEKKPEVEEADEDEEEDEEAEEEAEEGEAHGGQESHKQPDKVVIPPELQPEVNRLMRERIARDRKAQQVAELESIYGQPIEVILPQIKAQQKAQFEAQVKQYAEANGLTDELARDLLETKTELHTIRYQSKQSQRQAAIAKQKADMRSEPFFKELEADVDDLVAGDPNLDFKTAFIYLRGERVPQLLKQKETATEQRVISDVRKRAKTKVGSQTTSGDTTGGLSQRQIQLAKQFGIPLDELAKRVKGGK